MQVLFKADYDQDINYLVNRGERIRIFGVVALALVAPFFVSGFYLSELSIFLVYILAGLGLMVLIGFTGVVSFGHAAFLDIGAYTNSVLLGYDVPFFVSLPLAALLAGVIGAALGRAASKMHGFYMTIATPAFAIVVETAIGAWEPVTGGHMGLSLPTMREKDFGIWRAYSWEDYAKFAYNCAGGFLSLGLCRGDVVSILSENNKEWAWADMAAHCAGLTVNGVYPTYQAGQLEHMLNDSRTRVLIVENEEQLDKFLTVREKTPHVLRVYVIDWKSLRGFTDPMVAPIEDLYETGAAYRSANPAAIDAAVDGGKNGDATVLIYTSCTTGAPKGALISNRYLLFQMSAAPDTFPITADDDILTYLPLCHAAERVISLCLNLGHGTRINFAESAETVLQNIQELSPTVLFAVPRIWEKFYSRINTLMSEATWFGKTGYAVALKIGWRRAEYLLENRPVPKALALQFRLADWLVFRNLKQLLGLDRLTFLLSRAAPISADLLRWYFALGLPIAEVYGQTKTGLATITKSSDPNPGTIGFAVPGVEMKLGAQDEILVRGPSMFSGYLNNPEATNSALLDGWIHTGDVGSVSNAGVWKITDRLKDIIITAGGKNITPSQIENELKFSPFVADAVVIGDKRKYLTYLIMIDQENVENYAQTHTIPFADYKSLCARTEIVDLIEAEVKRANEKFASVEQVKKFRLINVLLSAKDNEMTPTMKLKRKFVETKYRELISEMY